MTRRSSTWGASAGASACSSSSPSYTIGHAGAFLPTPGGVGGTDGGLIGMFAAYGTPLDLATAAVLSYRVFQLGLPAILGAVSLVQIRNGLRNGTPQAAVAARYAGLEHNAR